MPVLTTIAAAGAGLAKAAKGAAAGKGKTGAALTRGARASAAAGLAGTAANQIEALTGGNKSAAPSAGSSGKDSEPEKSTGAKDTKEDMKARKESKDEFKGRIKSKVDSGEVLSDEDVKEIIEASDILADIEKYCEKVDLNTGEIWIDLNATVLDQLARHCFNYVYTYKEEAKELDPDIDTETPQLGVMAQDVEKVNPAAVEEINGAKFVNTDKLVLTLTGAVGELARKFNRMESRMEDQAKDDKKTVYLGTWE